jgi:hypothetical protein
MPRGCWHPANRTDVVHVRFGSLADICSAKGHVRFTPDSDRESGLPQKVMSALPPKADMCSALAYVCFGPIADIEPFLMDFTSNTGTPAFAIVSDMIGLCPIGIVRQH